MQSNFKMERNPSKPKKAPRISKKTPSTPYKTNRTSDRNHDRLQAGASPCWSLSSSFEDLDIELRTDRSDLLQPPEHFLIDRST